LEERYSFTGVWTPVIVDVGSVEVIDESVDRYLLEAYWNRFGL
jgi:hypothetical protein